MPHNQRKAMSALAFTLLFCTSAIVLALGQQPLSLKQPESSQNSNSQSIGKRAQLELLQFIMSDLEFTLLSTPSPESDPTSIKNWVNSTSSRFKHFKILAAEFDLDKRLNDSLVESENFLRDYKSFMHRLNLVKFTTTTAGTGGDTTWRSDAAWTIGSLVDSFSLNPKVFAIGLAGRGVSQTLYKWDESLQRTSLLEKIAVMEKNEFLNQTQALKEDHMQCLDILNKYSLSLAQSYHVDMPTFTHSNLSAENNLSPLETNSVFSLVLSAYNICEFNSLTAADNLIKASESIPYFSDNSQHFFTLNYKVPYLLMASHAYDFKARTTPEKAIALSTKAIELFEKAISLAGNDLSPASYHHLISYARANARIGNTTKANQTILYLQRAIPSIFSTNTNTTIQAAFLYDLAALNCQIGKDDEALLLLKTSYSIKPRRDPHALIDPELKPLAKRRNIELQLLAEHPLVGGKWESISNRAWYRFYPDGSLAQQRDGIQHIGFWSTDQKTLTLYGRTKNLPDAVCTYNLLDSDYSELRLTLQGVDFIYKRTNRSPMSTYPLPDRILTDSGTWNWSDNSEATFSKVCTTRTINDQKREFWLSHEHPLLGRINQFVVEP